MGLHTDRLCPADRYTSTSFRDFFWQNRTELSISLRGFTRFLVESHPPIREPG